MEEEEIHKKFMEEIDKMDNPTYWSWVGSWLDVDMVRQVYLNWDNDLKIETIKELKNINKSNKI